MSAQSVWREVLKLFFHALIVSVQHVMRYTRMLISTDQLMHKIRNGGK
jgi:hypothetical protein